MLKKRIAYITDLNFISRCVLYGARDTLYSINVDNSYILRRMRKEIRSVISNEKLLDKRHAIAIVYSVDNRRVAFSIVNEASHGDRCYEIYAMSIVKAQQNKGYGGQILDIMLNQLFCIDACTLNLPASIRIRQLLLQ